MKKFLLFSSGILLAAVAFAKSNRPEVGTVDWKRDFDAALTESGSTGKPVFAFFQEVPG